MEKFMHRDAHHGFSGNSPKTPHGSSENMDFNDVFGGAPRRFSTQEVRLRYRFGETVESGKEIASSPWSSTNEKPVFGDESVPRRRHHRGVDFFDDIFRGDESHSSPTRTDRDRDSIFASNPGSRIMSPAGPSPPKVEPFGTSLPAQFSLPARLTKALEFPTFGSHNPSTDGIGNANGLSSPHSSNALSRFSSQAIRIQDEIRSEIHPVYRQRPLSREASLGSEDSPSAVTFEKGQIGNLKKDRRNVDNSGNQFHFSIYKWAGREVPSLLPRVVGKSKDNMKYDRSASANGRIESKMSTVKNQGVPATGPESLKMECKREDLRSKEKTEKLQNYIDEETLHKIPESKSPITSHDGAVSGEATQSIKEEQVKTDAKDPLKKEELLQSELKPLHAWLSGEAEQPGNIAVVKESKNETPIGGHTNSHASKNAKKNEEIRCYTDNGTIERSSLRAAAVNAGVTAGKYVSKGKVREFKQEAKPRPVEDFQTRSQNLKWKAVGIEQKEKEVISNAAKVKGKVDMYNVDKKPDVSVKVDENLGKDEVRKHSPTKTQSCTSNRFSTNKKNAFSSEAVHRDFKISDENSDNHLEDDFLVQELSDDLERVTHDEKSEDTKAIDSKIKQWSVGKKGNIRSLLSTLQYVLWPGSGWNPVPLADLIQSNSVKRAYQKALLRLHPDKLQQKGAAFHHKYVAEKVFDILQEAWEQFDDL